MKHWWLMLVLAGCGPTQAAYIEPTETVDDDGTADDPSDDTDDPSGDTDVDTDQPMPDTDAEVDDIWGDAWLDVVQPVPGFYDLGAEVPLEAVVRNPDGDALPFDGIQWSIERGGDVIFEGKEGGAELDAGVHTVFVGADLPDGSRLAWAVTGIRVQNARTGIYAGSIVFTAIAEIQGQTITSNCVGALDITIDERGEDFDGSGGCRLALPAIGTIDLSYDLVGDIDDPDVSGDVLINTGIIDIPVGWEGGFTGPDRMEGAFAADAFLFDLEGDLEVRRITRFVAP